LRSNAVISITSPRSTSVSIVAIAFRSRRMRSTTTMRLSTMDYSRVTQTHDIAGEGRVIPAGCGHGWRLQHDEGSERADKAAARTEPWDDVRRDVHLSRQHLPAACCPQP
jgi:hypothetical protein